MHENYLKDLLFLGKSWLPMITESSQKSLHKFYHYKTREKKRLKKSYEKLR